MILTCKYIEMDLNYCISIIKRNRDKYKIVTFFLSEWILVTWQEKHVAERERDRERAYIYNNRACSHFVNIGRNVLRLAGKQSFGRRLFGALLLRGYCFVKRRMSARIYNIMNKWPQIWVFLRVDDGALVILWASGTSLLCRRATTAAYTQRWSNSIMDV